MGSQIEFPLHLSTLGTLRSLSSRMEPFPKEKSRFDMGCAWVEPHMERRSHILCFSIGGCEHVKEPG